MVKPDEGVLQVRYLVWYGPIWDCCDVCVLVRDHDLALRPWRVRSTTYYTVWPPLISFRSARRIQPVGSQILSGLNIAGHNWNLWKGPNSNWQVLSFVSSTGDITNFNADLKDFFNYLVQSQGVSSSQVRLYSNSNTVEG